MATRWTAEDVAKIKAQRAAIDARLGDRLKRPVDYSQAGAPIEFSTPADIPNYPTGAVSVLKPQGTEETGIGPACCPAFYEFELDPVPKPRQTQQDKWKQRPAVMAYRAFADELRAQAEAQGFVLPDCGWSIAFHMPMPASWSKTKAAAMFGQPHTQRPDLDNLLKSVLDALRPDQDCEVWELTGLRKYWSDVGRIIVRVES